MRLTGTSNTFFIRLGLTGAALIPVALAGGAGPQASSRTTYVAILSVSSSDIQLGPPLNYVCDGAQQVFAVPQGTGLIITSFRTGQRPDLSGLMPRVNAGLYRNSEWTWRQVGAVWALRFHGKVAATGCRLQP